ncbi:MAG TPA: SpoIIE family protein phosphatase [Bacteroidia bacterium]|nr:SpoIIE family protein phosphatase [Bacteroidia bacterium]
MRNSLLLFIFILFNLPGIYSKNVSADTLTYEVLKEDYDLSKNWLISLKDNPSFADPLFDDSSWPDSRDKDLNNYLDSISAYPPFIVWLRTHFYVEKEVHNSILSLKFIVRDACEIYLDGKKIKTIGTVHTENKPGISGFNLRPIPHPVVLDSGEHVLAIRYSFFTIGSPSKAIQFDVMNKTIGMKVEVSNIERALEKLADRSDTFIFAFFSGLFITLSLFHFILFLFFRRNRTNLYYSLFTLFLFIIFFGIYKVTNGSDLSTTLTIGKLEIGAVLYIPLLFIALLYQIFYKRILVYFWILGAAVSIGIFLVAYSDIQNVGGVLILMYILLSIIEILRIYFKAWKKKKEGAGIFLFGILMPPVGTAILALISDIMDSMGSTQLANNISESLSGFFGYSMLLSVSVSMTIYLAKEFSRINLKLSQQITEIKHLFQKTITQENEKKKILENQNIELDKKVKERTSELAQKNRDILDNLQYAQRIQSAILPETSLVYQVLTDAFILYRPKDIVSGDFYTFSQKDGKVIITAGDCTGHGVTGAFLSMIGISLLNQLVNESGITNPAQILNHLNNGIISALKQRSDEVSDGMDIAICSFDLQKNILEYSGANRPLYLLRNGEIKEIKPDKLAIGGFRLKTEAEFTSHHLELIAGDQIYIFSDGFADQFGGEKGKKLLSKRLREKLVSLGNIPMKEQEKLLNQYFDDWKGHFEQVDDVLLIGIRV